MVAIAAGSLAYSNQYELTNSLADWTVPVFVFFATWMAYLFHRFVILSYTQVRKDNEVIQWSNQNYNLIKLIMLVIPAPLLFLVLRLESGSQFLLAFAGAISIFYSYPLLKHKGKSTNLRNIPFLKIFLICFNWTICTVLIWSTEAIGIDSTRLYIVAIKTFCFVLALTIPFDIRDYHHDQKDGLLTLPGRLGINGAKIMAYIALAFWYGLTIYTSARSLGPAIFVNLILFLGIILILGSKPTKSESYYLGWIDGLIFLWGAGFCLLQYLPQWG